MAEQKVRWLTTGDVARLCSVTPDTVQKWIQKGRIPAYRTAGGHYRMEWSDVEPFIPARHTKPGPSSPPTKCAPQPLRCWEYMSDHGLLAEECKSCIVYRVRAAWCFEVLGAGETRGRQRPRCHIRCDECSYYRQIKGLPAKVLVVTSDARLRERLLATATSEVLLTFAANVYETSAAIGEHRPAFILVDGDAKGVDATLLECVMSDERAPGLKLILCGRGTSGAHLGGRQRCIGVLDKPFSAADVLELIRTVRVESLVGCQPG